MIATMSKPSVVLAHFHEAESVERGKRLQAAGYRVQLIHDGGQQELRTLALDPPSAFVIDLSRVPSHGRDIGLWLRTRRATRHIPLVFVGGADDKVESVRRLLPDAIFTTWDRIQPALEHAIVHPVPHPVVPESVLAGYSGTALPKKLGIRTDSVVCLVGAPEGFDEVLGELPRGVDLRWSNRGRRDLTLWFSTSRSEVERRIDRMREVIAGGPMWICWPKRASGVHTDLTEGTVRAIGLGAGLVDYKVAAIDETWSGLLFTERKR